VSEFLSVSLSVKGAEDEFSGDSDQVLGQNGYSNSQVVGVSSEKIKEKRKKTHKVASSGAINTTKHLWAGAVAAMVSRFCLFLFQSFKLNFIFQ